MTRHQTPARRTARWARGFAIVAAAALTLTGCMKIQTDLTLNPDNTGSMSMIMAISDDFAEQMGMDPQEMWDSMSGDMATDAPEGADQAPYAEDGYTGVKYTLAEAPIDQLSTQDMTIERVGDNYVFTGTMDLTDETTDTTDTTDPMTQAMMDTFIVAVSVTFPGAVSDHNGELDGNTVTWSPKLGEIAEMSATGSAIAGGAAQPTTEPSDEATATDEPADVTEPTDEATADVTASDEGSASSGFPWWLLGVVGAVLVAAVVGIVLLANRGRKQPSPAAAYAEGQPQWQGQPGQAQPPQWQGQPGQAQPPQWQGQPGQAQPPQWQGQPTQQMPPAPQTPPPPQWQQPQTPPPPQAPPADGEPTVQLPPQEPPADGQQPGQNPPA